MAGIHQPLDLLQPLQLVARVVAGLALPVRGHELVASFPGAQPFDRQTGEPGDGADAVVVDVFLHGAGR